MAIYKGIALPFAPKNGQFPGTKTDDELIEQNLTMLFHIAFGERVRHPERGHTFHDFVFENFDEGFVELVKHEVSSWIRQNDRRVVPTSIHVYQVGGDTDPDEPVVSDSPKVRVDISYVSVLTRQERILSLSLGG